jgi:hypothetical protein
MNKLPVARNTDIVVQELGKEILIYDLKIHKAYNLNETSSIVYKACDGKTSFAELKAKHKFTDEIIYLALDGLKKENLLEADEAYASPFASLSRREAIRKVGLATMIALPVISSLIAPTAAMAQSGLLGAGFPCTSGAQCSTGTCLGSCSADGSPCANAGGACVAFGSCTGIGVCSTGGACFGVGPCAGVSGAGTCSFTGTCTAGGASCFNAGACTGTGICSGGICA